MIGRSACTRTFICRRAGIGSWVNSSTRPSGDLGRLVSRAFMESVT